MSTLSRHPPHPRRCVMPEDWIWSAWSHHRGRREHTPGIPGTTQHYLHAHDGALDNQFSPGHAVGRRPHSSSRLCRRAGWIGHTWSWYGAEKV